MSERGIEYLQGPSKRGLDLMGSLAIGAALLPVASVVALVAAVDTKSNPIFKQTRVGEGLRDFGIIKFRTLDKRLTADGQTNGTFDGRASEVGQRLRSYGLDEIPQLINVALGHMSLVGIRPLIAEDLQRMVDADSALFNDWYQAYSETKPGLTGPGQLYRHSQRVSTNEVYSLSMRLDLGYIESASLRSDLAILRSTPKGLWIANTHTVDNLSAA